ncbi:hypothetical protein [Halobacteriovorax sp.]|uniref:hypothetical protein n=1 Tax=Halobacteriovorax sp. TaxID=2020862 RepID=UPI003AF205AF
MKLIISFLFTLSILASAPSEKEIKFASNVSPYIKDLILELYLNSKITQEEVVILGENLLAPIDNDFIELSIMDTVLKTKTTKEYKHIDISQGLFNELEKEVLKLNQEMYFSKRIAKKILKDLGELLTNQTLREYNAYIKSTDRNKKASKELSQFMNRISYLQFWIQTLRKPAATRKQTLLDTNLEVFNVVNRNLQVASRTGNQNTKGQYISINDIDLIKARRAVDKLFFDTTPQKDPDYQAPEELPDPVDSW